jgi:hypothetical protein
LTAFRLLEHEIYGHWREGDIGPTQCLNDGVEGHALSYTADSKFIEADECRDHSDECRDRSDYQYGKSLLARHQ